MADFPAEGSWSARHEHGRLRIQGVVRYPNDSSTAQLSPEAALSAQTGVPHFVLDFSRDKEPFCGPDLIGPVNYYGPPLDPAVRTVVVIDGDAMISIPVRAA